MKRLPTSKSFAIIDTLQSSQETVWCRQSLPEYLCGIRWLHSGDGQATNLNSQYILTWSCTSPLLSSAPHPSSLFGHLTINSSSICVTNRGMGRLGAFMSTALLQVGHVFVERPCVSKAWRKQSLQNV